MKTHRLRFPLVCILALALTTPAWGASPNGEAPRLTDPLARLWNVLTAFWAEEGCGIDPNGESVTTDAGCWIDPNGGCAENSPQAPSTDAGCGIDPHGGCATGN